MRKHLDHEETEPKDKLQTEAIMSTASSKLNEKTRMTAKNDSEVETLLLDTKKFLSQLISKKQGYYAGSNFSSAENELSNIDQYVNINHFSTYWYDIPPCPS